MEEQEAVERLRRRDISGLEVLASKYYVRAVRSAYLVTRDRALAEDLVQEAFIRAYERIDQLDPQRPFAPWFLRSVVNAAINEVNRRGRQVPLEVERGGERVSLGELLPGTEVGPETQMEREELRQVVWEALEELPAAQRAAVVMRYYLEMSEAEIAGEMEVPAGTVKSRLNAARTRLQGLLRPVRDRQ